MIFFLRGAWALLFMGYGYLKHFSGESEIIEMKKESEYLKGYKLFVMIIELNRFFYSFKRLKKM